MKCGTQKETQERLSNYGAMGGAVLAAYLVGSRKYRDWNPISKFAESMTVGYLGGYLVAPLLHKDCPIEDGMALVAPPVGEYGGGYWSKGTFDDPREVHRREDEAACGPKPPVPTMNERFKGRKDDPYTQWAFCAIRRRQEERKKRDKAAKGGFWSKVGSMPDLSALVGDLPDQGYYPAVSRRDIEARRAADPCSGIPRTINNCPPGARCAVGPSPNPEYRACREAAQEVQKESKGIPTWAWVAGGLGLGLLLARR